MDPHVRRNRSVHGTAKRLHSGAHLRGHGAKRRRNPVVDDFLQRHHAAADIEGDLDLHGFMRTQPMSER